MGSSEDISYERRLIEATSHRSKDVTVQLMQKSWWYNRFKKAARAVQIYDRWEQPIYKTPPAVGKWIVRGDTLPEFSATEPLAMANWGTCYLAVPESWDDMEMMQKRGDPTQLWDLAETIAIEAAWGASRMMSAAFFNGIGGRQPLGLDTLLPKTAPSAQTGTLGGLPRAGSSSATPFWYTNALELTDNFGTINAGTNIHAGILAFLQLKDLCTVGSAVPTDFITRRATYRLFKRALLESTSVNKMVSDKPSIDQFGNETVQIDGAWISWDSNAASDSVYCLHIGEHQFKPLAQNGHPDDSSRMDPELDDVPNAGKWLSQAAGLWRSFHPEFNGVSLPPRSPHRQLRTTKWRLHSHNLVVPRPTDLGIAYSDNTTRWSTW